MKDDLIIPRKWMLRAHGRRVVFVRGLNTESGQHVVMKALLWALYLPVYSELTVEIKIGDRYKPDVVALNSDGQPLFWGEAGYVSEEKIASLARRYPDTHFALAKWNRSSTLFAPPIAAVLNGIERRAPFDLISFPANSLQRFIDAESNVQVQFDDLDWQRLMPPDH